MNIKEFEQSFPTFELEGKLNFGKGVLIDSVVCSEEEVNYWRGVSSKKKKR